jgi:hypothetical protein
LPHVASTKGKVRSSWYLIAISIPDQPRSTQVFANGALLPRAMKMTTSAQGASSFGGTTAVWAAAKAERAPRAMVLRMMEGMIKY